MNYQIRWKYQLLMGGLFLLIFAGSSFGQKSFTGTIKDIETEEGLINATITYGDDKGVLSDNKGNFSIENPIFPLRLEISHLGYVRQVVIVRSVFESGLTILLKRSDLNIDQVEILGERLQRFFQKTYFYIIDYAFISDKILIIGYDQGRLTHGQLLLTNLSQDTLSVRPIMKPKRLFKDGFGNIHLFAKDSVYQLALLNNQLKLLYPTHESDFPLDLLQLQIAEDHTFIFKDTYGDGQLHVYSRIDTITKKIDTLKQIFDRKLYEDSRIAGRHKESRLPGLTIDYQGQMDPTIEAVKAANQLFDFTYFNNFVLHMPIISQVFVYGDEYIILDISNSEIHSFKMESLTERSFSMEIPQHTKRIKYFIQDEFTEKIYWIYYKGNRVLLGELDPTSGKIVKQIATPEFPYIENIKIRNGIVWFLYQPRLGETVRSLYRMYV